MQNSSEPPVAKHDFVIRIAGEAGEGVQSIGALVTQISARSGYGVISAFTPPSEIKGGYASFQIRLSDKRPMTPGSLPDVLLAFNQEAYDINKNDLREGMLLLYDEEQCTPDESAANITSYALPLTAIAKRELNFELGKNVVAVGMITSLFGLPFDVAEQLVTKLFGRKGPEIVQKNMAALEAGRNFIESTIKNRAQYKLPQIQAEGKRMVVSGNQSLALGALAGGVNFYAGYPITPATDIMEFLAGELPKIGCKVIQAEDEIAALGMVLGASYTGARSITATAGPGLSLMVELLGLAVMAEIPAVVVDVQRAGPSTGMPTRHEQGDLLLAAFGGHGEAARIVIAPTSVEDCFYRAVDALNLAERYQCPVLLLSDFLMAFRTESIPVPDLNSVNLMERVVYHPENGSTNGVNGTNGTNGHGENGHAVNADIPLEEQDTLYLRYSLTEDGVSPMAIPGTPGGQYVATGLEHTERGRHRQDPRVHAAMTEKRARKLERAALDAPPAVVLGDDDAEVGIITWGSTLGPVIEAVERIRANGTKISAIAPRMVWPLPDHQLKDWIESKRRIVVAEVNYSGHFMSLLAARYGKEKFVPARSYTGDPFEVDDIVRAAEEVVVNVR